MKPSSDYSGEGFVFREICYIWFPNQPKPRQMTYSLKAFLGTAMFVFLVNFSYSQASSYNFSQTSEAYVPLASSTVGLSSGWDDNSAVQVTIPFSFTFNQVSYTALRINPNGYITFGATAPAGNSYNPISATTGYSGAIAAIGRDLISNASTVVYGTEGTSPNRVFVVQWNNARRYSGSGGLVGDVLNFQIRIYETTNIAEVRYGTCTATNTTSLTAQVGLRGAANTDFNNRSSTTSWSSTTAGGANNSSVAITNTVMPSSGLNFRWAPAPPCTGTPNVPNVTTSVSGCLNAPVTLTATNVSTGTGISYQWQSSANGTSGWANVVGGTGATTASYTTTALTNLIYYRLITTCSASGLTSTSSTITVNIGDCSPDNDMCFEALPFVVNGGALNLTTAYATNDSTDPSCGGTGIRDIWYSFVYTGGTVTIQTGLGTLTDTRLAVYAACGGNQIACNDDTQGLGLASRLILDCVNLVQGNTYYIQVGGYQALQGAFTLNVTSLGAAGCTNPLASNYNGCATTDDGSCVFPALTSSFYSTPTGSNCSNLQFTSTATGNIVGYEWSFEGGSPSSATIANPIVNFGTAGSFDVTLTVTDVFGATASSTQTIDVENGIIMTVDITADNLPQQTSWAVFDENNSVVASGTSNDATFCINNSCHRFEIYDSGNNGICCSNGNGSYRIFINGIQVANGAQFTSEDIRYVNCPQGTACNDPIEVGEGEFTTPFANAWYEFTPSANGQYKIETCGLSTCDTKLWIYDYCNMAFFDDTNEATITYNDDFCGVQSQITPILEGGTTYYIRVGDTDNACGGGQIGFSISYLGPIQGCMDPLACNYMSIAELPGPCYYNGSPNCENLGPDLEISLNDIFNSLSVNTLNGTDGCLVNEGCLQGLGTRQILRFTTTIWNIGNQDYFIGVPTAANEQFEWDPCHNHYHYEGYAEYLLYNQAGVPMPEIGFKNGFCVLDLFCPSGFTAKYTCGNMGITAGCRDTYSSALACQWIDITNVPAGEYYLVVRTNWDQAPDQLGRYELRYDNNWAQVCISFGRDANNNIINFTKNISSCPLIEDCVGQPFGDQYADCAGNCPGTVRSADVVSDFLINELDVHQYLDAASRNVIIPVSNCTDLNSDGMISVADAAYLEECIHDQLDLGVNPLMLDECAWDPEIFDNNKSAEIGVASINTALGYVDIYIRNEDCEISGLEFELSGLAIENVTPLLPIQDWNPHIHFETEGTKVAVVGAAHSLLPVHFTNTPVLRVHYSLLEGQEVCVSAIVDVLDEFVHNILFDYGACASIAANVEADFSASSENVCAGSAVTFTPGETGTPTSWSWSFPGGTPSTSSSQFPVITYNTPGLYSVSLTVSNGTSSDEITVENLITVNSSVTYYQDADGDGFGNPLVTQSGCVAPTGYVSNAADCNDGASAINPSASEICNNTDDDCDTVVDEGFDMDNDGVTVCEGDCDDNNALAYPGAFELCNGNDEDCDDVIDEGFDQDNDGFTVCNGDCNDNDASIYPGATEICGNNIDEDCSGGLNNGCPVFIYYPDNDSDGYGTLANSINSYSNTPPAGYVTQAGDCNDNNAAVRPGVQELCITNYDDDCDGFVNEGCTITAVVNDNRSNAMHMNGNTYPACSNTTANLLNATASEETLSEEPLGAGQDVWYTFTAQTNGVRLTTVSTINDMVIELQDVGGNSLAIQNIHGIGGGEILAYGNLIPGTTYYVAVRNFNTNAAGNFSFCVQHLVSSNPDYGLSYAGLCTTFKCDWNGASMYEVMFTDGEFESTYSTANTIMSLSNFPGLQHDHTYQVYINSVFTFAGSPSVSVMGGPYNVYIAQHPDVDLRALDQCPTTRNLWAFIAADRWICSCVEYEWEFIPVDENDQIIGLETYYVESNTATRYLRVNTIPNVQPGNRYRVRVRPVFEYGPGAWGSDYQLLCVTQSAGLPEIGDLPAITAQQANDRSEQNLSLGLFPNPCNGSNVNIYVDGLEAAQIRIKLYDAVGRVVLDRQVTNSGYTINMDFGTELPNGLYSLEMSFDEERIVEKLLVSH